jgi:hypothetical protein
MVVVAMVVVPVKVPTHKEQDLLTETFMNQIW